MVDRRNIPTIYVSPEEDVIPPGEFSELCRRAIEARGLPDRGSIGGEVTTISGHWGNIWRGDIVSDRDASRLGLVTRAVCWVDRSTGKLRIAYAFGQRVTKL